MSANNSNSPGNGDATKPTPARPGIPSAPTNGLPLASQPPFDVQEAIAFAEEHKNEVRRSADYTIKGFLYQFNKTLQTILRGDEDARVMVEGIIEDIDVRGSGGDVAIQCKYHEAAEAFTLGAIYKPLLQMMDHFHRNATKPIHYKLYAFFPTEQPRTHELKASDIEAALASTQKGLQPYVIALRGKININAFLKRFTFEFGVSFDQLTSEVCAALKHCGLPSDEIDTLLYPNALQIVANYSIQHHEPDRWTSKSEILTKLRSIRTTAITRWTLALKNRRAILETRRKQLKPNLSKNARLRYFVLDRDVFEDFDTRIVNFIKDYIEKYHSKQAHIHTPLFCVHCSAESFDDIRMRLDAKGVKFADGFIGPRFSITKFYRDPIVSWKSPVALREFEIRLARPEGDLSLLNEPRCDDLFIISEKAYAGLNLQDVNEERMAVNSWSELYFILGLSNACD